MRIGINAIMFQKENKTGIPFAVENVLRSWCEKHPENEYYLFARKDLFLDVPLGDNWHQVRSPFKADKVLSERSGLISKGFSLLYSFVFLPFLIRKNKIDVFWGTSYFLPAKLCKTKYVVSIYDLAMFRFKHVALLKTRLHHKVRVPAAARRSDKILTISRASAEDIHELLKVRKNKIAISYLGGLNGHSDEKHPYTADMKPELDIKGRSILFISTIEPRKNVLTLIRAFEKYLDTYGDKDLYLVLAGGRGWKCDNVYAAAEKSRHKDRIIMPGYISSEEKQYLLENASVFAYPSIYEGFGIPVLEAFDKELPVITTSVSSLPEVGGDAAFYIDDPYDTNALCGQLRRVLTLSDSELSETKRKMKQQLARFSWDKNAEEIMRMFKRLMPF